MSPSSRPRRRESRRCGGPGRHRPPAPNPRRRRGRRRTRGCGRSADPRRARPSHRRRPRGGRDAGRTERRFAPRFRPERRTPRPVPGPTTRCGRSPGTGTRNAYPVQFGPRSSRHPPGVRPREGRARLNSGRVGSADRRLLPTGSLGPVRCGACVATSFAPDFGWFRRRWSPLCRCRGPRRRYRPRSDRRSCPADRHRLLPRRLARRGRRPSRRSPPPPGGSRPNGQGRLPLRPPRPRGSSTPWTRGRNPSSRPGGLPWSRLRALHSRRLRARHPRLRRRDVRPALRGEPETR